MPTPFLNPFLPPIYASFALTDANDKVGSCNSFIEGILNYYVALTAGSGDAPDTSASASFTAKYDPNRQMTQFCPPEWFRPQDARSYFYCEEHPTDREDSPSTSLITAFAENFPCTPYPWIYGH
jgi:Rap1a immunity proteins